MPESPFPFTITAASTDTRTKIQSLDANMEVRAKLGTREEEFRWVLTVELETIVEDVSDIQIDLSNSIIGPFTGTIRGGQTITMALPTDDFSDQGADWRVTKESITGINEDGSKQAQVAITLVGVSNWTDAPWNAA